MARALDIWKTFLRLQESCGRMAERAFTAEADTAKGEFISAFISERDLTFPRARETNRPGASR